MEVSNYDTQTVLAALSKMIEECALPEVEAPAPERLTVETIVKGRVIRYDEENTYKHIFKPHCFDKWIPTCNYLPLLFQHKEHLQVGAVRQISSDSNGLYFEAVLHDTPAGRDLKKLVEHGVIDCVSPSYTWYNSKNPEELYGGKRFLNEIIEIEELSLVTYPSNPSALLQGAGKEQTEKTYSELEKRLCKFFRYKDKLEVKEIEEIVFNGWQLAYRAQLAGLVNCN